VRAAGGGGGASAALEEDGYLGNAEADAASPGDLSDPLLLDLSLSSGATHVHRYVEKMRTKDGNLLYFSSNHRSLCETR